MHGNKGRKFSEEHKRKIGLANSIALKGRKIPKKVIENMHTFQVGNKYCVGRIPWNKGLIGVIKQTPETRLKIRNNAKRGSENHLWKGGITPINKQIRQSLEYRLWREAVFKRDNWTCVWCGQVGGELNADHIKRFADYPELRFAIDNGRTLCVPCHRTTYIGKINVPPKD